MERIVDWFNNWVDNNTESKTPVVLKPLGLITTIQIIENDWMVYRYYDKNGKRIKIAGFGRTKVDALRNLDFEIWQESQYI